MNIGIDVRKLRDYGIGTHILNVVLHAAKLDESDRFFLYCDPLDRGNDNGHFTWISEPSEKYSLTEQIQLSRKASKQNIDLFHSPHFTLPLWLKCKSIVTVHDLIHLKFREYFPIWKVKAAEVVIRKALRKADTVVTVSRTSRNDILEFFPETEGKIEVLYNRLSESWSNPPAAMDLKALGIEKDYLLYVGNFKKHKGIQTLLKAYEMLKDPPQLVLAGNAAGNDSDLYETIFSNSRIRLLGFAEMNLLQSLYSKALLFVFPSLYEGFGYPPLEAMACGAPVLSSDALALKEILSEGAEYFAAGNVEALKEKITQLIGSTERRRQLTQSGKWRAKEFQTDVSPRHLLQIYKRLSG
jgi:glycosyltransferase involved in cell wall biosynthesis